ncbi:MAG: RNB domain-containing ribonuclease [Solirubrobacterales bacterium]|nr:RNB domain-containing ribonuclease [Solirubrobacterales bacterium]
MVSRRGRFWVGEPLFDRGPQVGLARGRVKLQPGRIALCRIDQRGGQPIVDLGRADNARDVVGALIADRGLRPTFRDRHEQEARSAIARLQRDPGPRRDLTAEPTFTVDPAGARDFDDAVSARPDGDGHRVWVHIADVAAHVKPESGLDREALARANSTYAPGTVSPMLPASLSSDACSLNPGVERLAVTAELELAPSGEPRSTAFYRSRIRSDARLDYDSLDRIFAGTERAPEPVADAIASARRATAAIGGGSRGTGLEVTSAEPEFTFTPDGEVEAAQALVQTEAHTLIEKLMVLTNEQVARLLERKRVPTLYRVHEQPDPARVMVLIEQLASLGVPTPALAKSAGPSEAGEAAIEASRLVAAEAERRGHGGSSLSSLVLRALKPARYSEVNLGHAGLGSGAYCHFTSPIRRYPDLVAHRGLLAVVEDGEERPSIHEVAGTALHCSDRERESMRIERDGDDICAAFLLQRELFERGSAAVFEGEVSGVIPAGAFILFGGEHADIYEGFFPARRMPGERFEINEVESALIGTRSGRRVGIGDRVEVRVDAVEPARGRVDLAAADEGGRERRRRSAGRAPRSASAGRRRRR